MPEVTWFHDDAANGLPAVIHPGRGRVWWRTPNGLAWTDEHAAWIRIGGRIARVACRSPVRLSVREDVALLHDARGLRRLTPAGTEPVHAATGHHTALSWTRQGWAGVDGLPVGATHAEAVWPFVTGRGLVWRCLGFVYRLPEGGRVQAVTTITDESLVRVGPAGGVLIGSDGMFHRGAAPGRPIMDLRRPVQDGEWGVRWTDDGTAIAGLDEDGGAVLEHLVTRRSVELDGLPVDAEGTVLRDDQIVTADGGSLLDGCREASWALRGAALLGPGGRWWSLGARAAPGSLAPVHLGATVATDAGWATVQWETGAGAWLDTGGSEPRTPFQVPLDADDEELITSAEADGDAARLFTSEGRCFRVVGARLTEEQVAPAEPVDREDGIRIGRRALEIETRDGPRTWPLDVDGALRHGAVVHAWSQDGALYTLPG